MKIIHITKISGIGGIQSLFERSIRGFKKLYPEIDHELFSLYKSKEQNYISHIHGISGLFSLIVKAKGKKNIFHSYNNIGSIKYLILFLLIRPRNLIFHERGNAWNINKSKNFIIRINSAISSKIVCNSNASKYLLMKKFSVPEEKLIVIYNGVNDDIFNENFLNLKKSGYESEFRILFIGRIESNKGLHTLIKAMSLLNSKVFSLQIVGDGSLKNQMYKLVKDLKVKNVNFVGYKKDIKDFLYNAHLLVVPSIREPLGNVVIEGALSGTPIIASKIDGITEIINNNSYGYLIEPKNIVSKEFINQIVPLPQFVIKNNELVSPKELSSTDVSEKIEYIFNNYLEAITKSELLKKQTETKFSLSRFINNFSVLYFSLNKYNK